MEAADSFHSLAPVFQITRRHTPEYRYLYLTQISSPLSIPIFRTQVHCSVRLHTDSHCSVLCVG